MTVSSYHYGSFSSTKLSFELGRNPLSFSLFLLAFTYRTGFGLSGIFCACLATFNRILDGSAINHGRYFYFLDRSMAWGTLVEYCHLVSFRLACEVAGSPLGALSGRRVRL